MVDDVRALVNLSAKCSRCGIELLEVRNLYDARECDVHQIHCPLCNQFASAAKLTGRIPPILMLTAGLDMHRNVPSPLPASGCASRLLGMLTVLLPVVARERFVAEVLGDLSDCDIPWGWARYLSGMLMGLPRLAWMLHREHLRGRAE